MEKASINRALYISVTLGILIFLALYFASLYNYLLFHSLAETFSIIVAYGIFMFAWNSQEFLGNNYLLFIGIAYLFIGGLDLIHTLGYKGMGVFQGYDANLPTQIWIAARYLQSISLLIAPLFLIRPMNVNLVLLGYSVGTTFLLISIFGDIFPNCFIEGIGLTPFKRGSEYVISLILMGSIVALFKKRNDFDESVFRLLVASIILTIGAELSFTFYISVYGFSNLVGHYFKLISFYLIYKAIIVTGLVKPYDLLFRKIKKSEKELRLERDNLQKALAEIKTLRGILPICSHCKKIRDDRGYWNILEKYIQKYSDAKFSHSICPECVKEHYPALDIYED
ncbi:MAG: hypothetical protein HQ552_13520 [Desulfobacteraceae bacterium]|nr:hypothetical protein [Desulfobacteraceae bacterium]